MARLEGEVHKVKCPYCVYGSGTFLTTTEWKGSGKEERRTIIGDTSKPVQCDTCYGWYKIVPRVKFVGVRIAAGTPYEGMKQGILDGKDDSHLLVRG